MDSYWEERAVRRFLAGDKQTLKYMKDMEKVYYDAFNAIQKEINAFYGQFATDNKLDMTIVNKLLNPAELKSFKHELKNFYDKIDPKLIGSRMASDYRNELRTLHARMHISRLEQLKVCIKNHVIDIGTSEVSELKDMLLQVYENTYSHSCYDIDRMRGFSIGFEKVNYKKVNKALESKWLGSNYSDRVWKNKGNLINQLDTTFLQGVVMGKNPNQIGEEIANKLNTASYCGKRLARTECGHIMGEATMDSYKNLHVAKYQYLATLDTRTSHVCRDLDGKVFNVKDAKEGVNYPEMHPNCRSTTVPYFDDEDEETFRASKENGEYKLVPANMSYHEWEKTVA